MTAAERAPLDGVIEMLVYDLSEIVRMRAAKVPYDPHDPDWVPPDDVVESHAEIRAEDVERIRGLIRAIRVLRREREGGHV